MPFYMKSVQKYNRPNSGFVGEFIQGLEGNAGAPSVHDVCDAFMLEGKVKMAETGLLR